MGRVVLCVELSTVLATRVSVVVMVGDGAGRLAVGAVAFATWVRVGATFTTRVVVLTTSVVVFVTSAVVFGPATAGGVPRSPWSVVLVPSTCGEDPGSDASGREPGSELVGRPGSALVERPGSGLVRGPDSPPEAAAMEAVRPLSAWPEAAGGEAGAGALARGEVGANCGPLDPQVAGVDVAAVGADGRVRSGSIGWLRPQTCVRLTASRVPRPAE